MDWQTHRKQLLNDPKVKAEYDRLQPEFAVIRAMLEAQLKKGITKDALAKKVGTNSAVISRVASGKANPSLAFLQKLAEAMSTHLEIKFVPR